MDVTRGRQQIEELVQHLRDDGYGFIAAELEAILAEALPLLTPRGCEQSAGKAQSPDDVMDVYVPGAWKCLTCGFALSQATIFMGSGEIGCSRDQVMKMTGELCPNDGEPMARVTWRDRAIENQQWGESLMNEIITAVGADHLPGALERIKQLAQASKTTVR